MSLLTSWQRNVRGHTYVKNYEFDFRFAQWGNCSVIMTSVSGHLTSLDFADRYRKWETTPPGQLFEAETIVKIDPVSL
jgi:DNA topoisomerase III